VYRDGPLRRVCGDYGAIGAQFDKNICLQTSPDVVRDVVTATLFEKLLLANLDSPVQLLSLVYVRNAWYLSSHHYVQAFLLDL